MIRRGLSSPSQNTKIETTSNLPIAIRRTPEVQREFKELFAFLEVTKDRIDDIRLCGHQAFKYICQNSQCGAEYFVPYTCGEHHLCIDCYRRYITERRQDTMDLFTAIDLKGCRVFGTVAWQSLEVTLPKWLSELINKRVEQRNRIDERIRELKKRKKPLWKTADIEPIKEEIKELEIEKAQIKDLLNPICHGIYEALHEFYGGQVGGLLSIHEWGTEIIWEDHLHFHILFPNLIKKGKRLKWVRPYLEKSKLNRLRNLIDTKVQKELKEAGLRVRFSIEVIEFAYLWERSNGLIKQAKNEGVSPLELKHRKLRHKVNYNIRGVIEDAYKGYISHVITDFDYRYMQECGYVEWLSGDGTKHKVPKDIFSKVAWFGIGFKRHRQRWFGWLGDGVKSKNLKMLLGIRRERNAGFGDLDCPKCGSPLALEEDMYGKIVIYSTWDEFSEIDKPPPPKWVYKI